MAAAGLKREAARIRLQKCRAGLLPRECLMESRSQARSRAAGRTAGKKENWQGLGNRPRTERLQYIPGPTATELRMSGSGVLQKPAAVQPPPPPPPKKQAHHMPSAAEIAAKTGLRLDSAHKRLARYNAGKISRSELLAPRKQRRVIKTKTMERVEKLMIATGLSEDGARRRLALYEAGMMDVERLFRPCWKKEVSHEGH